MHCRVFGSTSVLYPLDTGRIFQIMTTKSPQRARGKMEGIVSRTGELPLLGMGRVALRS
jgi:hypothetical protein